MSASIQASFTGGEIAPALYARADMARYLTSLRECRNFLVQRFGGVTSRPGLGYLGAVQNAAVASRLIAFDVDATTSVVCEFSQFTVRFLQNGAVVTAWGTLATPYAATELLAIQAAQVGAQMVLVHPDHGILQLRHVSAAAGFTIGALNLFPAVLPPSTPSLTRFDATTPQRSYSYVTTTIDATTGDESQPSPAATILANLAADKPITVTVASAGTSNVYRGANGFYGFVGTTTTGVFLDDFKVPDMTDQPPSWENALSSPGQYPRTVTHFQQRRWFGGNTIAPQTLYASRSSELTNFSASSPARDDDAIDVTLAATRAQPVRHLVALNRLLVLTARGVWSASAGQDAVLTPNNTGFQLESGYGASDVVPVLTGEGAIYVQAQGTRVRDLVYNAQLSQYGGSDLSVLASHLFQGYTIIDMAWQEDPNSVLWCVRSDGALLALTYLRDQEVWGWSQHVTDGVVERACVAREGNADRVYCVVQRRTFSGTTTRGIERMALSDVATPMDAMCLDAALSYDGRNTTGRTLVITGATYAAGVPLTMTVAGSVPSSASVGDEVRLQDPDGTLRCAVRVTAVLSPTQVTGIPDRDVPITMRAVPLTAWAWAESVLTGMDHLAGRTIAGLVDGNVVQDLVVSNTGTVTLPIPGAVVHLGLPYVARMQTLDLTLPGGPTVQGKQKVVSKADVHVLQTRGLFVGIADAELMEMEQRTTEGYDGVMRAETQVHEVRFPSTWDFPGRVVVEQRDPVPATVLAILPEVTYGG